MTDENLPEPAENTGDDIQLPKELEDLAEKVGGKEIVSRVHAYFENYSGPLPHPKAFAQYRAVMHDAPEQIFGMAERQQEHRFGLEDAVINSDIRRADTGLWLGFALFLTFGIGAIILLAMGKDIQGYSLLLTSLVGGIGSFLRVGHERASQQPGGPKKRAGKKKPTLTKLPKKTPD